MGLVTEVQRTLELAAVWTYMYSRTKSSACKISGFSEVSVFDLSSVP